LYDGALAMAPDHCTAGSQGIRRTTLCLSSIEGGPFFCTSRASPTAGSPGLMDPHTSPFPGGSLVFLECRWCDFGAPPRPSRIVRRRQLLQHLVSRLVISITPLLVVPHLFFRIRICTVVPPLSICTTVPWQWPRTIARPDFRVSAEPFFSYLPWGGALFLHFTGVANRRITRLNGSTYTSSPWWITGIS